MPCLWPANNLRAICSKIKTRVLPTFLGQKMFDIVPKMSIERIFLFLNKRPAIILPVICSEIEVRVLPTFWGQNYVFN